MTIEFQVTYHSEPNTIMNQAIILKIELLIMTRYTPSCKREYTSRYATHFHKIYIIKQLIICTKAELLKL